MWSLQKSNILLIGPTGSGKTLLRRRSRECWMCRSPLPTPPRSPRRGYVGEDVENILLRLLQAADF